jgi:hypothetical protein
VQLKKMRMPSANSNPDNFWPAFRWKCSETNNRKKKGAPFDCAKISSQVFFRDRINVSKETQREVHLLRAKPTNAAQFWIQRHQKSCDRLRQLDCDEESLA